jgi:hypothetical protein
MAGFATAILPAQRAFLIIRSGQHPTEPRWIQAKTLREERGPGVEPVRIGYRSFDRQWLIPDSRVIDRPRIALWQVRSDRQLYLTEPRTERVAAGPAVTFTANVPDTDHYRGHSGGRVFPLYRDQAGHTPNVAPGVLELLRDRIGSATSAEDLFAYVAGTPHTTGSPLASQPTWTAQASGSP